MKNIKDLGEKEVIWCVTLEECEAMAALLDKAGLRWCGGESYLEDKVWINEDISVFCFNPNKGEWCWLDYYEEHNYNIHTAKEFFAKDFFPPQKYYTPQEVRVITNALIDDIIKEYHESNLQKPLINILRERMR